MNDQPRCRFVASDQPRAVCSHRHKPRDPFCDECEECPLDHCGTCGHKHVGEYEYHCATCVGETRAAIETIVKLDGERVLEEAVERGRPATEAALLAGPAADPIAWRQFGRAGRRWVPEATIGQEHPLWTLGMWDLLVREHMGIRSNTTATVQSAADYIRANLTLLARDPYFPLKELHAEVQRSASHLEDVLMDGERPDTGAPCVQCQKRLERVVTDKGEERFWCSRCRRTISREEYDYANRVAHKAKADRLTAADMADRIGVPASTVRRWAAVQRKVIPACWVNGIYIEGAIIENPPLLRSCGRDSNGRKLYRVRDAETLRDTLRVAC